MHVITRRHLVAIVPALLALALLLPAAPARAAHPGSNGPIAYQKADGTIRVLSLDGSQVTIFNPIVGVTALLENPSVSPDGTQVAFVYAGPANTEIWTYHLGSGQYTQLTAVDELGLASSPSWEPDGSAIVFTGIDTRDQLIKLWSVAPDGRTRPTPIGGPPDGTLEVAVSPRGDVIATWDEIGDRIELYVRATGEQVTLFTTGDGGIVGGQSPQAESANGQPFQNALNFSWAPDGTSVLFDCNGGQVCEIRTDGTGLRIVTDGIPNTGQAFFHGSYTPAGDEIVYAAFPPSSPNNPQVPRLFVVPASTGRLADGSNETQVTVDDGQFTADSQPDVGVAFGTTPTGGTLPPTPLPGGGGSGGGGSPSAFDDDPAVTPSIGTSDPTTTALDIAAVRFPRAGSADVAVLSRNDRFPDSLAGTALTGDGPLLLTSSAQLDPAVGQELARALPAGSTVYLLGGVNALSATVEQAVRDLGLTPVRLAGPDRIATALAVADEVQRRYPGRAPLALVARAGGPADNPSAGWADSVSAGGLAARNRTPILLTDSAALDPRVEAWLTDNGIASTALLGGPVALSDTVLAAAPGGIRVAGPDRTATAVAVVRDLWQTPTDGPRRYVLVNGFVDNGWAFGLASAGIGADHDAPTLLVGDQVSASTAELLGQCGNPEVQTVAIGDASVIGSAVLSTVNTLDGQSC